MRWPLAGHALRIQVVGVLCAIVVSVFAGRLLQLQAFDSDGSAATAAARLAATVELLPVRGEITDLDGAPLATTETAFKITADPTLTAPQASAIASVIAAHAGGSIETYLPALTKPDTRYSVVARHVPAAQYERISTELSERDLVGIFRENDPIRTYPGGTVGASLIGFTGWDGNGLAGLEYSLNQALAGSPGEEVYDQAPNGNRIPLGTNVVTPAVDGVNYQLTIDSDLQFMVEQRLAQQVEQTKSASGMVVVMDIETGELRALATYPSFDPRSPGSADPQNTGNRAVQMAYEPGSVQKILTMAALIDEGKATADTRVVVPESVSAGGITVRDNWPHGTINLTARGVLVESSNIGTIMLAREISEETLHDRLTSFGLGRPTGIELPGEASGRLPDRTMPGWTRDQISFGQGLSVTAVQEAAAVAGILNGGMYNQPTILAGATDADGDPVPLQRTAPRRVVSETTSTTVAGMMESILYDQAHVDYLGLNNWRTGGKTGTAQRYNADCGCYRGRTTSYAGFAPVEDPKLLTYVVLDDATNGNAGMTTAGPVYTDVMNYALPRYGVLPSTQPQQVGKRDW